MSEPNPPTPFPKPDCAAGAARPNEEGGAESPSPFRGGVGEGFFPQKGALLGLDYGTVRVGLSVSDPDRIIASPLETYARQSEAADAVYYANVASEHRVVALVVGLPLHANGAESDKSREARAFGAWLTGATGLPVVFWDERFTTALAEDALLGAKMTHKKRRERRDRVAAQMILQAYIEAGCPPNGTEPTPPE